MMRGWVLGALLVVGCSGTGPPEEKPDTGDGSPDAGQPDAGPQQYAWRELAAPSTEIARRWGHVVADLGDGRAVIVGGTTFDSAANGEVTSDVIMVDARGEMPTFTRLDISGGPGPRYCGCATYDAALNWVIVVGGRDSRLQTLRETWVLDLGSMGWWEVPVTTPAGGVGCAMAYSPDRNATFLFGGLTGSAIVDTTWRFVATAPSWTQVEVSGPEARYDAMLRHVATGEPMVLFGGAYGANGTRYADVWRFNVTTETWSKTAVTGEEPEGRRTAWLAVEPDGAGFIMGMGTKGLDSNGPIADLWRFDFSTSTWAVVDAGTGPRARGFSLHIPGGPGRVGLLLGGNDNVEPLQDLWVLHAPSLDARWR